MAINQIPFFDPFSFGDVSKIVNGFEDAYKSGPKLAASLPKMSYPPFNVKKVDTNKYVIEMAVAGFDKQNLEIELQDGTLTIKGQIKVDSEKETEEYLHKGIASRAFTRKFDLADTVQIKNAELLNGMLKIWLESFIPESKKAVKIDINDGEQTEKQLLQEKA